MTCDIWRRQLCVICSQCEKKDALNLEGINFIYFVNIKSDFQDVYGLFYIVKIKVNIFVAFLCSD